MRSLLSTACVFSFVWVSSSITIACASSVLSKISTPSSARVNDSWFGSFVPTTPSGWVVPLSCATPLAVIITYWFLSLVSLESRTLRRDIHEKAASAFVPNSIAHSTSTEADVVIVGAGCAGATVAAALGKRGVKVICVERDLGEPNRIVGELLQPSGVELLKNMGLGETLEGFDAQVVTGYGIFRGNTQLNLSYPSLNNGNLATGRSFHNGRFLMALRRCAQKYPSVELRQGTVTSLQEANGRVTGLNYKDANGEVKTVTGALTVVCDGLFSNFRKTLTQNTYTLTSRFLGLIIRDAKLPLQNGGHVILAEPTPVLCYPISSNEARMLIDFPDEIPASDDGALTDHLLNYVGPQLPEAIRIPFERAVKQGDFKAMPNRKMMAAPARKPGTLMLGDIYNVRHPLTGGGMTVAFSDIASFLAVLDDQVKDFNHVKKLDDTVQLHYNTRTQPNAAINILADALYNVFGQNYADLREACFHYLSMGGTFANGPIRLLSGVSRSQTLLITHFFAVAFYGVGRLLFPLPTPSGLVRSFLMIRDAVTIILPLILQEHPTSWLWYGFGYVARTLFWVEKKSYFHPI